MEERQLLDEEHHLDLPLAYMDMPEYASLLEAEDAFWDRQPPGPVDSKSLLELVLRYMHK